MTDDEAQKARKAANAAAYRARHPDRARAARRRTDNKRRGAAPPKPAAPRKTKKQLQFEDLRERFMAWRRDRIP